MRKKLTDLCAIQYGYAFDSGSFTTDKRFPPLVRIRDVKRGFTETFYSGDYPSEYVIHSGDLLVGMDGEFNIARWRSGDALLNQRVCKITATDGVDEEYLRFALQKALKEIEERTAFVTVKHLSAKELNKLELDIPDINEQARIAQILCKLERVISRREKQLYTLGDLIKARFVEMFGDYNESVKLSEVATVTGGLTKNSKRDSLPLKLPYLRVANVSYDNIDTTEMLEIGLTQEERDKTLLKYGDLLFVEGNGSPDQIGRVAVWRNEITSCVHQNHLIKARFNTVEILPEFAMRYYMTDRGRRQVQSKAVSTSGLYTLSVQKVADFLLPKPPISQQKQFAAFAAQIDKSKSAIQKTIDETQLLFDSLMQKYFG